MTELGPRPDAFSQGDARREDAPPNLLRAVRGGMRQQQLETALQRALLAPHLAPPADEVLPVPTDTRRTYDLDANRAPPSWHWLRVLSRRGRQLLRTLAMPLLYRFEWRVRTAVDKSYFAAEATNRLGKLEEHAATQLTQLTRATQTLIEQFDHNHRVLVALCQEVTEGVAVRLDNLARDINWILQRAIVPLADGDYLVRTPSGWLVAPGEDERLLMALIETAGLLEPGTTAVLAALLRQGDTMVDVGAHIGTMTIPAACAVGPRGHVVAVEPGARATELLRRSLHINSLTQHVTVHDCAAGAVSGEGKLHVTAVLGENSLIPHSDKSGSHAAVPVAVRPLDDLVPPGPVRVVKIDAEGYELEVWKGMRRIVSENPELAVIIEFGPSHLAHADIPIAKWFEALQAAGFTPWEIDESSKTLRVLRPISQRATIFSVNLLLLRGPPSSYPGLRVS